MPETKQISFSHREVTEILLKQQEIHEGFWAIYFEVGLAAGGVPTASPKAPPGATVVPAAMILINKVGIARFEQPNAMTIDASEVNPVPTPVEES